MGSAEPAQRDAVTGAWSRSRLQHLLGDGWPDLVAGQQALSVLILDLDAFKDINDAHGHPTGDDVLRRTAEVLRDSFRSSDLVLRYGGDEFVVVAPGVSAREAVGLAERAREALRAAHVASRKTGRRVDLGAGFSIGAASFPDDGRTGEELLQVADRRLFADKRRRGRLPGTLWRHRRLVARLLGVGAVAGLAVGSYVGARVRTTVNPVQPPPLRSDERRIEVLLARIAELEARLAIAEAPAGPALVPAPPGVATPVPRPSATPRRPPALPSAPAALAAAAAPTATPAPAATPASVAAVVLPPGDELGPVGAPVAGPERLPVIEPPVPLEMVRPEYPRLARALRQEAVVEVRLRIDARGRVVDAEAVGPRAGFGFEPAAIAAARRTRFRPGQRDGQPVEMQTGLIYRFFLEE